MSIRLRIDRFRRDNLYADLRPRRVKLKWTACRQCGHSSWFQIAGYQVCRDCVAHIDRAIIERERLYREHAQHP